MGTDKRSTTGWDGLVRYYTDGSEAARIAKLPGIGWSATVCGPYDGTGVTLQVHIQGSVGEAMARALCDVALGHEAGRWYTEHSDPGTPLTGRNADEVRAALTKAKPPRSNNPLHGYRIGRIPAGGPVRHLVYRKETPK